MGPEAESTPKEENNQKGSFDKPVRYETFSNEVRKNHVV